MKKILAVCSPGGHLVQLEAILGNCDFDYVEVVSPGDVLTTFCNKSYKVSDFNRQNLWRAFGVAFLIVRIILARRPDIVISTGAAVGGVGIVIARLMFVDTIWIDSIANSKKSSLTGLFIKPFTKVWISQWQHVADAQKGEYIGKIFNFFERRDSASL